MESLPRKSIIHPNVQIQEGCAGGGLGVKATGLIQKGELIERSLLTRLLESYEGHLDPHVFIWWKSKPGTEYKHAGIGMSTAEEGKWRAPTIQTDKSADNYGEVNFTKEDFALGNLCWCQASGNAIFYNTGPKEAWNTRSVKDFENDTLELRTTRDIQEGEEIIIMYSSINWRACWDELRGVVPPTLQD